MRTNILIMLLGIYLGFKVTMLQKLYKWTYEPEAKQMFLPLSLFKGRKQGSKQCQFSIPKIPLHYFHSAESSQNGVNSPIPYIWIRKLDSEELLAIIKAPSLPTFYLHEGIYSNPSLVNIVFIRILGVHWKGMIWNGRLLTQLKKVSSQLMLSSPNWCWAPYQELPAEGSMLHSSAKVGPSSEQSMKICIIVNQIDSLFYFQPHSATVLLACWERAHFGLGDLFPPRVLDFLN